MKRVQTECDMTDRRKIYQKRAGQTGQVMAEYALLLAALLTAAFAAYLAMGIRLGEPIQHLHRGVTMSTSSSRVSVGAQDLGDQWRFTSQNDHSQ